MYKSLYLWHNRAAQQLNYGWTQTITQGCRGVLQSVAGKRVSTFRSVFSGQFIIDNPGKALLRLIPRGLNPVDEEARRPGNPGFSAVLEILLDIGLVLFAR